MLGHQSFDIGSRDLQAVVEQTVQQHPPTILLDAFGVATRLKINGDRVNAVYLLVGVAAAIAYRDDQHQQLGMLLGDLRQDLDEIKRPVLPRVLLGVGQAVVPRLEFVQQHRGSVLQQLKDQLVGRDVGLGRAHALPLTLDVGAVGMTLEKQIPQELVALAMQAFAEHEHLAAQSDLADLWVAQGRRPGVEPRACGGRVIHRMVERGH
ncbi:hypothetical protein D3C85_1209430 [compost metagenome]